MATTVKNGSKGSDVKNLQTQLNGLGYNLSVDGVFGSKTLAAVKDYQSKNGLTVDGIVGTNTWNSLLNSGTNTAATNTAATGVTQETGPTAGGASTDTSTSSTTFKSSIEPYQAQEYTPSESVNAALSKLQSLEANKPGEYESQYRQQLNDMMDKLLNRDPFSYDLNGDMLWQQYKDQYTTLGQQAMRDTMGNAAALSGGYGNSYASTAGNQAYQAYLQQLNEMVPELYDRARNNYDRDLQWDLEAYGLMNDREAQDYNRYRDALSDYYNDLNLANDRYLNERNFDYSRYSDDRDFGYNSWLNSRNFEYEQYRDQIADNQWQTAFDEDKRRYDQEWAYQLEQAAKAGSGSGSGGSGKKSSGGGGSPSGDPNKLPSEAQIAEARGIYMTETSEAIARQRIEAIGGTMLWEYLKQEDGLTNGYWDKKKTTTTTPSTKKATTSGGAATKSQIKNTLQ